MAFKLFIICAGQAVVMKTLAPGTTIRYTTDGTMPGPTSTVRGAAALLLRCVQSYLGVILTLQAYTAAVALTQGITYSFVAAAFNADGSRYNALVTTNATYSPW
jgi:hypothetical protein